MGVLLRSVKSGRGHHGSIGFGGGKEWGPIVRWEEDGNRTISNKIDVTSLSSRIFY